jgi:hypothetical protein
MKYWKTTIVFEVLTEGETALPDDMTLGDIVELTVHGHASGDVKSLESEQVHVETMARLLEDQRSGAEFLLGERSDEEADINRLCPGCLRLGTPEEVRNGAFLMICKNTDDCCYEDYWEWVPPKEED